MNTYIVKYGDRLYGPFKTPSAAAEWAVKESPNHIILQGSWTILKVLEPRE